MLANAGFFPFGVIGLGICGATVEVASLLGIRVIVFVERTSLASLDSSLGCDVATRVDDRGAVVGFVAEPDPPSVPALISGVCPVVDAVLLASAMVVFRRVGGDK